MLKKFLSKTFLMITVACFSLSALYVPAAQAAVIGTVDYVEITDRSVNKDSVAAYMGQESVKQQLLALGVDPSQVQDRVDAMTDDEISQLAANIEQLPAGGDIIGLVLFLFVLFVITDMLGATDIFPFVKPILK